MIVGIIGAGNIGGAFAMALGKPGNEAVIDLGSFSIGGQLIQYPRRSVACSQPRQVQMSIAAPTSYFIGSAARRPRAETIS
jgi:glycerol-3-phosphate dehydrogenase